MKTQDFDRLSAYLDNQLSPSEKAALEQRLGREPELRAALSELRLTVKAVRSLPRVKPPRSFTLTAAQVGARPRRAASLFGTLRLAATLSALALVLVIGGDFAASRGAFGPAAAPAEVVSLTTDSAANGAAEEAGLPVTAEAEMSIMQAEETPPTPGAEPAPGGGDGAPAAEATAEMSAIQAPETADSVTSTPASTDRQADATQIAEAAPDSDETATNDMFAAGEAGTPSTKVVPEAEGTALAYGTEAGQLPPPPGLSPLRLLEAALAMLTVLLGLGTWLASRNA